MAVKIRLKRFGKIRSPRYRIVVADSRTKRDGRVIEEIGTYQPTEDPSIIEVVSDRAQYWLGVGAQPTEQVRVLLKLTGDWGTFKGDKKATNTVKLKESAAPFVAQEKKKPVLKPKAKEKAEESPRQAEKVAKEEPTPKAESASKEESPSKDESASKKESKPKAESASHDKSAREAKPASKTKAASKKESAPSSDSVAAESTDTSSRAAGESESTDGA